MSDQHNTNINTNTIYWLNGTGATTTNYTNKRAEPNMHSAIRGRLSSIGELARYLASSQQLDGWWYRFQSLVPTPDKRDTFWVREDVIKYAPVSEQPEVKLDIAYHSQNDANSNLSPNDCGPASSCMMLERAGVSVTVNAFMSVAGIHHKKFTTFADNIRGVSGYGYTAVYQRPFHIADILRELQKGNPVFCLVYYTHLNPGKKYGHFLVVIGYTFIEKNNRLEIILHDPNRQSHMTFPVKTFGNALAYQGSTQNVPYQCYIITDYPPLVLP